MSKCRLILVRHGESEGNKRRSFLGHTDLPITELGHMQAEAAAKYLDNTHIDIIYSSDLLRAYMTAEHIASRKDMSIIANPRLREIYAGEWEDMLFDDIQVKYPEDYYIWRNDIGSVRCTGGESFVELYNRIIPELARIAEESDGLTVCIATHATPIRCARLKAHGLGFECAKDIHWTMNASITVIDVENGEFKIVNDQICDYLDGIGTVLPKNV